METHTRFVGKVVDLLRPDARIDGVAIGGSWIGQRMDQHSDLDFVVGVSPEHHPAVMAERTALAARLGPLLAAFTGDFLGEPRLLVCLYGPPLLHVDLKFVATPDLASRVEDPEVLWERDGALTRAMAAAPARWPTPDLQWIEDRFWTWVHYAATKLARGELFEVIDFLGFLRRVVLGPLAAIADGARPNGTRRLERTAPTSVDALRGTVAAARRGEPLPRGAARVDRALPYAPRPTRVARHGTTGTGRNARRALSGRRRPGLDAPPAKNRPHGPRPLSPPGRRGWRDARTTLVSARAAPTTHRVFDPLLPRRAGREHAPALRALRHATACTRRRRPRRRSARASSSATTRSRTSCAPAGASAGRATPRRSARARTTSARPTPTATRSASPASSPSSITRASSRRRARIHGRPVIEPAIVYANILLPGQELAVHTDVPEFRGANRKLYPQWLMVVMHHSGLFDAWRMPIATAVGWFNDCRGGEFAYYPDGPRRRRPRRIAGARQHRHHPRHRHRLPRRRSGRRRRRPLPPLRPGMHLVVGRRALGRCATATTALARVRLGRHPLLDLVEGLLLRRRGRAARVARAPRRPRPRAASSIGSSTTCARAAGSTASARSRRIWRCC